MADIADMTTDAIDVRESTGRALMMKNVLPAHSAAPIIGHLSVHDGIDNQRQNALAARKNFRQHVRERGLGESVSSFPKEPT